MRMSKAAAALERMFERNLFLIGIALALIGATQAPEAGKAVVPWHLTGKFLALIFLGEGLKLDLNEARHILKYSKVVIWGLILALGLYPAAGYLVSHVFGLAPDYLVGFVLMCAVPCSLASAMAIAVRAGGDALTAILLLVALNLVGLVGTPENLALWLGGTAHVDDGQLILKLVLYLFLPLAAGQAVRRFFPKAAEAARPVFRYVPALAISAIVYISCSEESARLMDLRVSEILFLVLPCLVLHLSVLLGGFFAGRYVLRFPDHVNRSVAVVCSEKPLTLSAAIWSMDFAHAYPLAVFPLVIFYVVQIFADSTLAQYLANRDEKKAGAGGC